LLSIKEVAVNVFRVSLTCSGEFATGLYPTNSVRTQVSCSLLRSDFFFYLLPVNYIFTIGKFSSAVGRFYWNSVCFPCGVTWQSESARQIII